MDLVKKKCEPCEGGMPPASDREIKEYRQFIGEEWVILNNAKILRTFNFVNYKHTIDFVNRVAELSENEDHHPVMHVHYSKVELEIWTFAINGLSVNDFILAAKIERL